jgi:ribosome-associated protein
MIHVTPTISIDPDEIQLEFVRASGPGGQHVNKTATAVQLRFDAAKCPSLSDDLRKRLSRLAGRRMTSGGILVIDARRFRTQDRNRQDAIDRLVKLIRKAAEKPKHREKTRPTVASRGRRLEAKRHQAGKKRLRQSVPPTED